MIDYETIISKIRRLPEPLLREVDDFIDFLQMKRSRQERPLGNDAQAVHPAMKAFGLWKDDPELENLVDEIYANRRRQGSRPRVSL